MLHKGMIYFSIITLVIGAPAKLMTKFKQKTIQKYWLIFIVCSSVHLNNIYLDYYVINNNPLLLLLYIYLITFWIQNISVVSHSVFRGTHHWVPRSQRLFGGQIVGQALVAAAKSVSDNLYAHSLHCYFVRAGKMQPQVKGTRQRL